MSEMKTISSDLFSAARFATALVSMVDFLLDPSLMLICIVLRSKSLLSAPEAVHVMSLMSTIFIKVSIRAQEVSHTIISFGPQ